MEERRKTRVGRVVSNKMSKTVVVEVESQKPHPFYKKVVRRTTRFKAHDETNACDVGDSVKIVETRPLSKDKRWWVAEVMVKGEVIEVRPVEVDAEVVSGESSE